MLGDHSRLFLRKSVTRKYNIISGNDWKYNITSGNDFGDLLYTYSKLRELKGGGGPIMTIWIFISYLLIQHDDDDDDDDDNGDEIIIIIIIIIIINSWNVTAFDKRFSSYFLTISTYLLTSKGISRPQQGRQSTYNVTRRGVCATNVAVEKQ